MQPLYAQYRSDYIEATKLSNHDEDRTGSDLGQSAEKMKVAAAVLLTAQGAPYIYQGEELGYWGTKSNGDEYVRTPILWDKAGNELASGSLSGKIDMQMLTPAISVEAQADDDGSLLNLYRTFAGCATPTPCWRRARWSNTRSTTTATPRSNPSRPGTASWTANGCSSCTTSAGRSRY